MKYKVISSSSKDIEILLEDLSKKLEKLDFTPNFGMIIITQSLFDYHKRILKFLEDNMGWDTVTFFTDGFGTKEGIFMHGILILLLTANYDIFVTGKGPLDQELEKITTKLQDYDVAIAVYPAIYFPRKTTLIKGFLRDRFYWFRYRRCKNELCKRKLLKRYSDWVQKERLFIPINKVLRILGKSGISVGSINLVPLEVHEDTPLILHNFRPIGRNVLVIGLKNADLHFKDIFPERGDSFEETKEILRKFFAFKDEVKVLKEGNVIGEINGMSVREYIKERFQLDVGEDEFIEKIEKGEFSAITPYGLAFISMMTNGATVVGLLSSPLNLYPYIIDLDVFQSEGLVLGEIFSKNPEEFVDFGELLSKSSTFKILFVDSTTLLAYRSETYRIYDFLSNRLKGDWVVIFISPPGMRLSQSTNSRYISEIEPESFYFGSGTSLLFSLKS